MNTLFSTNGVYSTFVKGLLLAILIALYVSVREDIINILHTGMCYMAPLYAMMPRQLTQTLMQIIYIVLTWRFLIWVLVPKTTTLKATHAI